MGGSNPEIGNRLILGFNLSINWCYCGIATSMKLRMVLNVLTVDDLKLVAITRCRWKTKNLSDFSEVLELRRQRTCQQEMLSPTSVIKIDIYNFSDLHLNDQKRTFRVLVNSKELDNSVYRCIRSLLLKCELNCSRDKRKCAIKHSLSMFFTHHEYRKQELLLTIIPANRKISVENLILQFFEFSGWKISTKSKNIF